MSQNRPSFLSWALLPGAAVLWTIALPNLFGDGWGLFGWLAPIPLFWFLRHRSFLSALGGGAVFSFFLVLFSQFWLLTFQPTAFAVVIAVEIPEYALALSVLALFERWWPRTAPWWQALLWAAFEWLRTVGFLGYPYASLASTQWQLPWMLQSASWAGPWLVTAVMTAWAAWSARVFIQPRSWRPWVGISVVVVLLVGWGAWRQALWLTRERSAPQASFALVQHVQDPWKGGYAAYEAGYEKLKDLTVAAQAQNPASIVVWSETAFVPSVFYHEKYRDPTPDTSLVLDLVSWLKTRSEAFLIGNDHREKVFRQGRLRDEDWNAVLAWQDGWKGIYKKRRLVPFTEYFPYKQEFPWIWQWLEDQDTHFWQPGTNANPLTVAGLKVGTPVCFEDAFGNTCRPLVANGAQVLVNVTDDSWSGSIIPMRLHLALAVWRAVENRVPLLQAANGGTTAAVAPDGKILARYPEFTPGVLKVKVPLPSTSLTLYTQWGDWMGRTALVLVVLGLAWGFWKARQRRIR